jgi:hypothetical protein
MKTILVVITALAALAASPPTRAADVGVSIQISEPGVYGRIDIGRFPQPQVVVRQPVVIHRPVAVQAPQPVYLWVPPGHRKNWRQHCGRYQACGVPVYFVRDDWYGKNVRAHDRRNDDRRGRDDGPRGRGDERGQGKGHGKHD